MYSHRDSTFWEFYFWLDIIFKHLKKNYTQIYHLMSFNAVLVLKVWRMHSGKVKEWQKDVCVKELFHYLTVLLVVLYSTLSQVHWVRRRSLLNPDKILDLSHSMSFSGNRSHVIVPGLEPFSEYKLTVYVFNKKGNGPKSDPVTFNTPEGGEVILWSHSLNNPCFRRLCTRAENCTNYEFSFKMNCILVTRSVFDQCVFHPSFLKKCVLILPLLLFV